MYIEDRTQLVKNMERKLVMLGGWTDLYRKAKDLGFNLTVFQKKQDIKDEDVQIVDQLVTSPLSDECVLSIVESLHKNKPFDAVVSFQELGLLNAALIAEQLGIQGNPLRPVSLTRDKYLMRQHLLEAQIPSIPFMGVKDAMSITDFGNQIGWPIILKPANGVGSIQVHKINGPDEVNDLYDQILIDPVFHEVATSDFPNAMLIAEKFIIGKEVSVEAVSWAGIHNVVGITDKLIIGESNFVEVGHTMPSELPLETTNILAELVERFLDSIGHVYGPTHTEIILSDDGPVIVESHTRTGGDRIFEMVERVYGVDMIGKTLEGFAGVFDDAQKEVKGGAAIRFLQTSKGTVEAVHGIEEASKHKGVISVDVNVKPGAMLKESRHSAERPGFVLAIGDSSQDAALNAESALGSITVEVA